MIKTFADVPFFSDVSEKMSADVYASLLKKMKLEHYSKGDFVFQQGNIQLMKIIDYPFGTFADWI